MNNLDEGILGSLKEASLRAAKGTLSLGKPVTRAKDNFVIRLYPDGSEEIVKPAMYPNIKVDKTEYNLR